MKESTHLKVFYVFTIFSIILIVCAYKFSSIENAYVNTEHVIDFNDNWHYQPADKQEMILTLPADIPYAKKNSPFIVSNTLPDKFVNGMTLCVRSIHQTLRVTVDGEVVYEYGLGYKRLFGSSPGSGYHFIRIQDGKEGQPITIEFTTPYINNYNYVNSITYGSKVSNVFQIFKDHLVSFILCTLICLSGFLFLLIYLITKKKIKEDRSLLYLGIFAIVVSIWSSTETGILQFVFGNQYIEQTVSFISLSLCPIIFLLFIKASSHIKSNKMYMWLFIASVTNFIVVNTLQLLEIKDYFESLNLTLIVILFVLAFTLYTAIKEVIILKNKSNYVMGFGVLLLCVFTSFDLIRYLAGPFVDCSLYFRIGLFLFILVIGFELCTRILGMIELGINAKALEKLAYVDILTQISNRTAFDSAMVACEDTLNNHSNIILMMFDLNYLKKINDNCGHNAGDSILVGAASCIKEAIGNYGTCYRIGGDEFAAIIKESKKDCMIEIHHNLQQSIDNYNKRNQIILSLAYGYANYDAVTDKSLFITLERADKQMYEHKLIMKSAPEYIQVSETFSYTQTERRTL